MPKKKSKGKQHRPSRPHYDFLPPGFSRAVMEASHEYCRETYPIALADMCVLGVVTLGDKFDWTKEEVVKWCNEVIILLNQVSAGEINLGELQVEVEKDYGILVSYDTESKEFHFETPTDIRA